MKDNIYNHMMKLDSAMFWLDAFAPIAIPLLVVIGYNIF